MAALLTWRATRRETDDEGVLYLPKTGMNDPNEQELSRSWVVSCPTCAEVIDPNQIGAELRFEDDGIPYLVERATVGAGS